MKAYDLKFFKTSMKENMEHEAYKEKYGVCDPLNNIEIIGDDLNESYKNLLRESMRNIVLSNMRVDEAVNLCDIDDLCKGNMGIPRVLMPVIEEDENIKHLSMFVELLGKGKLTTDPKKLKEYGYDVNAKGHKPSKHPMITSQQFLQSGDGNKDIVNYKFEDIEIQKLKATQKEINKENVDKMYISATDPKEKWKPWLASVVTSDDNFIIDGHHRWAASLMYHLNFNKTPGYKQVKMKGQVIDLDAKTLLAVANAFTDTLGVSRKPFK